MSKNSTSFSSGNEAAMKHGAGAYLLRTDPEHDEPKPLTVSMSQVERSVLADLRANGPRGVIEASVVRFETAAELLWSYMQRGEKEFRDSLRWWGYMQANAQRAARDLAAMPNPDDDHGDAILASYKAVPDDDTSE